eukprot:maker-scaffold804_size94796-snap-gene-0.15 protein:Tk06335 transcript:maker-scaffold804_size94796-snap-gene-0.15-mRNA-1 annotation:"elements of external origin"
MAQDSAESKAFLNHESPKKRCCTVKCSCIVCGALLLVLGSVLIAGYLVYKSKFSGSGKVNVANNEEWAKKLLSHNGRGQLITPESLSGAYELVSFDPGYEDFLKSMGIPFFVLPIILNADETITIEATSEPPHWNITRDMAFTKKANNFTLDAEFELSWGRDQGTMHSTCSLEAPNVLACFSEERKRGWTFEDKMIFSHVGMINDKFFVTEGLRAKKFYQKLGLDKDQVFESPNMPTEPPVSQEESPFSIDESSGADDFWDDEW